MHKNTNNLWINSTASAHYPRLRRDKTTDVVVIGGGITGLTAGLLLIQGGKKVALVDQHQIATGESGNTTAHITEMIDSRYHSIASSFGKEGARLVAESSRVAMDQIQSWVERLSISCDFLK